MKRGRFFRNRHSARHLVRQLIGLAQKIDGVQILVAAVNVRHPLAGLPRVVEIQHGGDGVHAQSIDVILLQPEQRVRNEERANLVAAEVEDQRAPVAMLAQPRIFVLVKRGSIEERQSVRVLRKMRGHPVHDHADARLVAAVDEIHEILRRAVARRRRKVSDHLIAP